VRVVSERIKNSLIKSEVVKDWTKITVLPVFTDIEHIIKHKPNLNLHDKYPQFKFIILMASRLSEEKNISLAVSAFREVNKRYPSAGLIIVGDGNEREKLIHQTTDYKLQSSVIFEPWSLDLISYYKTSDLFLSTSSYEGYGMTLIEAASSECPIVTTDVGIVGEIINEDNALVCGVGDSVCIAQKIILAIENRAIRELLVKDALKAVSRESVSKEEYLREYKKGWEK
jgi:glycosyltransferase involved in cell wall biosynthesis